MSSIDSNDLFEQYYQREYDFNTVSLSIGDVVEIKRLVREKRVDYAQAPLGTDIFSWILNQSSDIRFESVSFDSDKIDGLLYIPTTGKERAYIILNSSKPLVNQIFTAAHEFYHYIMDYQKFKEMPYICDFSMLKDVNEKKASRFAAELLLPEQALSQEITEYCLAMDIANWKEMKFSDFAALAISLTVKYQMPLKAVIYRLVEEHYINNVDVYIKNYAFIKMVLREIRIFGDYVSELYSTRNDYIRVYSSIYRDMEKAYSVGNASKENILEDAEKLNLDMNIVRDFLEEDAEEMEDEDDDEELFAIINAKRG